MATSKGLIDDFDDGIDDAELEELDESKNIPDKLKQCVEDKLTLSETLNVLNEIEDNAVVYMGTKSGSSWLTISYADDVLDDLKEYTEESKDEARQGIQNKKDEIQACHRSIESLTEKQADAEKSGDIQKYQDISEKLAKTEHKLSNAEKMLDKYQEDINKEVDFGSRQVTDIYKHCNVEPFGYSIVITGEEIGKYWFADQMITDGKTPPSSEKSTVQNLKDKLKESKERFPNDKTVHEPPELVK